MDRILFLFSFPPSLSCSVLFYSFLFIFIYLLYKRLKIQEWKNKFVNLVVFCSRRVRVREVCLLVAIIERRTQVWRLFKSLNYIPAAFIYILYLFLYILLEARLDCCAVLLLLLVGRWQPSAIWSLLFFSCFSSSLSPTTDQLTQTATTSLLYFSVTSSATSRLSHLDMAHWFFSVFLFFFFIFPA